MSSPNITRTGLPPLIATTCQMRPWQLSRCQTGTGLVPFIGCIAALYWFGSDVDKDLQITMRPIADRRITVVNTERDASVASAEPDEDSDANSVTDDENSLAGSEATRARLRQIRKNNCRLVALVNFNLYAIILLIILYKTRVLE